jgi:hypothetical protein
MKALQYITEVKTKEILMRYGDKAHAFLYQAKFSDKSEKELERCILYFAELEGFQAERIKVKPNRVDNRRHFIDAAGFNRTIGSVTFTKSSMQAGSADMSLTIRGMSVKCEIKIGKDFQKKNQKEYQQQVERAGGQYWIVKTFQEFFDKYHQFIQS